MPHRTHKLRARGCGALLGLAVGDALGFPFVGRSRTFARTRAQNCLEGFERHESGFHPIGQVSDDTQIALAVARALGEDGGESAEDLLSRLLPLWRDRVIVGSPAATCAAMESLLRGRTTLADAGLPPGALGGDALSRAVPVGIRCHDRPADLARIAGEAVRITHHDVRLQAAAAGLAAAVAWLVVADTLILRDFLAATAAGCGRFHGEVAAWVEDMPHLLSITEHRAFETIGDWACAQAAQPLPEFDRGVPDNGLFLFLEAIYYFLKSPLDAGKALKSALGVGGELTTLCGLVGALAGAFLGEDALPAALVRGIAERDALGDAAAGLAAAVERRRDEKRAPTP